MTDLENRFWLCEQVLEVRQQGGMSLERALAMLHKLTDLETHEPYLSDQLPVPAVTWDYGEPLVDDHVETLQFAHAAVDLATHQWGDDLEHYEPDDEPPPPVGELLKHRAIGKPTERCCPICGVVLERRPRESYADFAKRQTDSASCGAKLRHQNRREEQEAMKA